MFYSTINTFVPLSSLQIALRNFIHILPSVFIVVFVRICKQIGKNKSFLPILPCTCQYFANLNSNNYWLQQLSCSHLILHEELLDSILPDLNHLEGRLDSILPNFNHLEGLLDPIVLDQRLLQMPSLDLLNEILPMATLDSSSEQSSMHICWSQFLPQSKSRNPIPAIYF